jgi:replicative DNA helicase
MGVVQKDLFDKNASLYVLSCLMRKPLLLQEDRYAFVKTDFNVPLHQMVFFAIFNMAQSGVQKISPQDVDLYLKQYGAQYEYYKKERGYEFVLQCYQTSEGSDDKQFEYYYNRLKKFSMLRDLESIGIDTTSFYDTEKDALNPDIEDEKLNKINLNAIPERIRELLVDIENRHIGKDTNTSQTVGKGIRDLVAELRAQPEVGLPLDGDIVNYAARGARLGKLYTYSAPSGAGKTRYMVGNACAISMPYLDDNGHVIIRGAEGSNEDNYQRVLFVTTEQQADEIQTMILSYVSGVNEKKILLGNYSPDEYDRVNKALDIIEKYQDNFIIECIPDPSIAMVKARLAKYIVQDCVEYIFYDYIFSSPGLLSEFRDVAVREDVALMMLSNSLKETAMVYKVFIQSATQLNDGWSKKVTGLRDQNCLRGSKAIADKIDIGLIGVRLDEEEYKQVDAIWTELARQNPVKYNHKPNIVIDIYKNRRGELNGVKIFRYFDYGTCRCYDMFVTDSTYQGIKDIGQLKYAQRKVDFLDLKTGGIK